MQRVFLFFFSFFFFLMNSAFADVTVRISDIEKKKMKVTYTHIDNNAGNKVLGFPEQAFDFANGPVDVISAREINADQGLKYHKFSSPNSMDIDFRLLSCSLL